MAAANSSFKLKSDRPSVIRPGERLSFHFSWMAAAWSA